MMIFNSDLDNTLIYSYKHNIGEDKVCVEIYQGRDISFMTGKSYELLKMVREKTIFVPTTTRTIEQYNRIDLGTGAPPFALVCNGGVLLADGVEDESWYQESLDLTADSGNELEKAARLLKQDPDRSFEVRNVRNLFLFTKSEKPEMSIKRLSAVLDMDLVDVFNNGLKVYVVPKRLDKGTAVKRLKKMLHEGRVIAAGDSEFDVPMLKAADYAIAPEKLAERFALGDEVIRLREGIVFSDGVLEFILRQLL
ncbi:HAD hydrolase family protein [Clostridium sp. MCC353]|uniref:HAD hydrolase family protein n=1 Tax=Clostridium sp. MCC353 TaxID=2592646 RepID=UPI002079380D|nr:HAD hydrolase family protein [Clostridium sp. MCC353]